MALHPRLTPKRRAYLEAVTEHGIYEPRHGSAANNCLGLGWVESVVRVVDTGEVRTFGGLSFDTKIEWLGQRITDAGRKVLAEPPAKP